MSIVPRRYSKTSLTPFQCHIVGAELHLANKLIEKAISGLVHCPKYNKVPIALRYGTSGPKTI